MPATTPDTRCRVLGCSGSPKRQRIQARDRPRAHGEDVAQDAADAGRRALIGLDIARMVVALHLEHHREPVADIDHAGILARPLDHPGRLGRQPAQMDLRGFVRAMLVPHRREDAELGERRLAPDQIEDALIFVGLEAVLGDEFRRDADFVRDHNGHKVGLSMSRRNRGIGRNRQKTAARQSASALLRRPARVGRSGLVVPRKSPGVSLDRARRRAEHR